jgi:channel protein (hemolysin III family)
MFLTFGIATGWSVIRMKVFPEEVFGDVVPYDIYWWLIGGVCYIVGALLYILKVPERFFPGKLCIVGNSHQIFHCLVLTAVFIHCKSSIECYLYRSINGCPIKSI